MPPTAPVRDTDDGTPGFDTFDLPDALVDALAYTGIVKPTPVQAAVIPDAMAGNDVLGRAQTGSGKTLAFGLPVLSRLAGSRSRPKHPRALIVVPTRELAGQVERSLDSLASALKLRLMTVYGGTAYDRQIRRLRQGVDVVIATPGRLQDLMDSGHCRTDDIEVTVLDEADHLCDLGFYPAVNALLEQTPPGQRMLLSATLDGDVDRLVRTHLRDPQLHELDPNRGAVSTMAHHVMVVGGFREKVAAATALVEANPRSIIFTRTREGAVELREALDDGGIPAVDLHGNLSQRVRERNLQKFSTGKAKVVVATDVAARGIHVDNVDLVVHFDAPNDPKAYLHRSGRTARAGESGTVVTITTPRQVDDVVRLQSRAGVESRHHDIRTTPRPMTPESLAESGEPAPTTTSRGGSGRGPRRAGSAPRSGRRTDRTGQEGARPSYGDRGRNSARREDARTSYGDRGRNSARRDGAPSYDDRGRETRRDGAPTSYEDRGRGREQGRARRTEQAFEDRPRRGSARSDSTGRPSRPAGPKGKSRPTRPSGKKARWTAVDKKRRGR